MTTMKRLNYIIFSTLLLSAILFDASATYGQDEIDIGAFESVALDRFVVKARPNADLQNTVTNVSFTIRWPESSNVTDLITYYSVFNIQPQGDVEISNGYKHLAFVCVGTIPIDWTAGQEYEICDIQYVYTTGDCTQFELIDDEWAASNNAEYYFEVLGVDKTGEIYESVAVVQTVEGYVAGSDTICEGSNTGTLTLVGHSGEVLTWQKNVNSTGWVDIPGSEGFTTYSETPPALGTYEYRAEVQKFGCNTLYSDPSTIEVTDKAIWTGVTDSNWGDITNWNGCGVPDITVDVIIPSVNSANYPRIDVAAECNSLIIETGATVTLLLTGSLNVGGNIVDGSSIKEMER